MNKNILGMLICTFVLLVGISAVNAIDSNSTDELMACNSDDAISVCADDGEVLSVEDMENEVISVNDDDVISAGNDEVLNAEINDDGEGVICDDVLGAQSNEECLSAVEDNSTVVLAASQPPTDVPVAKPVITHSSNLKLQKLSRYETMLTKEAVFAKVKMLKKDFKRFVLKTPSKKNKKLWKKYVKFDKVMDKKLAKSMKKRIKAIKKKWKIDWYYGIRPVFVLKGKYCTANFICMCYRYV